jgi:cytochrome c553
MMKSSRAVFFGLAIVFFARIGLLAADIQPSNTVVTTPAVYVPDMTHASGALGDDVLAWDGVSKKTNAAADLENAHFTFYFTNVSSGNVAILDAHPSCGCTTAQLPQRPWMIPPGTSNQIGVTVNLAGKTGTIFKYVDVSTDRGIKRLNLQITIQPPVVPAMSDADRANGVAAAKIDRQAVFKNDCAACHAKPAGGKYGKALYDAVCAICHEAPQRATMVPDLHNLKAATSEEFWRTWISQGKAGSLMPAFATAQGGPLSDLQIASLAAYLNATIPSHVAPPQ